MCIAFQNEDTGFVSLVGYMAIVYALLADLFIFGENLGTTELLGCLFVILVTLTVAKYRFDRSKQQHLKADEVQDEPYFKF